MDSAKLARKLEPLMPRQVRHWMKVRELADAGLRSLIDQQIISTAYRVLGDFNRKLLLSLPPRKISGGTLNLGNVLYETDKWPFGLRENELLQNLAVFGRSGAGKTNVVFHIVTQLAKRGTPFLFLDWKRTARHLLPQLKGKPRIFTPGRDISPLTFNPFTPPPGLEPRLYTNQLVDILGSAYTLGDGAKSLVQKAILSCYDSDRAAPTVKRVLEEVERLDAKGRVHGWQTSAVRALQSLALADLSAGDAASQHELVTSLIKGTTIIELNSLNENAKQFLVPVLFLWLYHVQLATRQREKLQLVVVIEEAHHVLYRGEHRAKESVMDMLLRQCREIGIGLIVVDQHPHLIS